MVKSTLVLKKVTSTYFCVVFVSEEANSLACTAGSTRDKAVLDFIRKLKKVQHQPGIYDQFCKALYDSGTGFFIKVNTALGNGLN